MYRECHFNITVQLDNTLNFFFTKFMFYAQGWAQRKNKKIWSEGIRQLLPEEKNIFQPEKLKTDGV